MPMKDERMKKTTSNGCLHSNRVWLSKLPCRNVTFNDPSSQFPPSKIDFRHSTSSVVRSTLEQDETRDNRPRLSWEGFQNAGKSFDFDLKSNPRRKGFHGASQLQQSRSCMERRKCSDNDNFPKWLEDNLKFSRPIEVPLKRKKRLWNWKPLRALAHVRKQQFRCIFTLHVHRVEGLPWSMNGLLISVRWRRKYREEQTIPARICEGTAEFEETLHQICTINGSRMSDQNTSYKSKVCTLLVTAVDAKGIDFGEHRIDLSRLLPKHLEDGTANCWTMSFKLAGMAQEGTLSVTFSCKIPKNELQQMQNRGTIRANMSDQVRFQSLRRFSNSHPESSEIYSDSSPSISGHEAHLDDQDHLNLDGQASIVNDVSNEIHRCIQHPTDVKRSISLAELFALELDINFSNPLMNIRESNFSSSQNACQDDRARLEDDNDYKVIEKGVEMGIGNISQLMEPNRELSENSLRPSVKEKTEDHKIAQQAQHLDTLNSLFEENVETKVRLLPDQYQQDKKKIDESKASTFHDKKLVDGQLFNMLGQDYSSFHLSSESDPDSPRECLLKQIEREYLLEGANLGSEFRIPIVSHSAISEMGIGNISQLMEQNRELSENSLRPREKEKTEDPKNTQQAQHLDTTNSWLEKNSEANVCLPPDQYQQDKKKIYESKDCTCQDKKLVDGKLVNMPGQDYSSFHLSSESDPDSPRARLLKQFEREYLLEGPEFCIPAVSHSEQTSKGGRNSDEELHLDSMVRAAESEFQKAKQAFCSKLRATMIEKEEVDELLEKWGMGEEDFQTSPVNPRSGFGSPVSFPPKEHVERPSLAEGVGSVVRMRDGGFLGSMSPMSKTKESLLMQVSRPLVVSAEIGSSVIDILSRLASLGAEILSAQAKEMMPLEDITGKTIQQLELQSDPGLQESKTREFIDPELNNELGNRSHILSFDRGISISQGMSQVQFGTQKHKISAKRDTQELKISTPGDIKELKMSASRDVYNELVFLEELVPSAMEKIESLAVEGLKIQSDMAEQDAPSNLNALCPSQRIHSLASRTKESDKIGLEGTADLGSSDVKDCDHTDDGLMAMAVTLDEWMKLDAAMANKGANERSPKILPEQCDVNLGFIGKRHTKCNKSELERNKYSIERWGTIGNTLTIALRVQLHDPLRNFEPVGAPMMALVKAERAELPPSPTTGRALDKWNCEVYGETKEMKEESPFKVTNVHVAGLKLQENGRANGWSNPKQKQSGSRWLIANGMGKSQKHPLLKQMSGASRVNVKPRETLWSISTLFHSSGKQGNEIGTLDPHIRNPDIIFPNDTINFR